VPPLSVTSRWSFIKSMTGSGVAGLNSV